MCLGLIMSYNKTLFTKDSTWKLERLTEKYLFGEKKSSRNLEIYSICYTDSKACYISQKAEIINLHLLTISSFRREQSNISPVFYHTVIRMTVLAFWPFEHFPPLQTPWTKITFDKQKVGAFIMQSLSSYVKSSLLICFIICLRLLTDCIFPFRQKTALQEAEKALIGAS